MGSRQHPTRIGKGPHDNPNREGKSMYPEMPGQSCKPENIIRSIFFSRLLWLTIITMTIFACIAFNLK